MVSNSNLYVIGEGWGFDCAIKGLEKEFVNFVSIETNEAKDTIQQLNNKILIFAGYKPIVPHEVLNNNTCINIHYSLLPKYRGLHSTVWAILNDEDYLGLSVHIMTDYIDDGPIIYQYKVANDRIKTSTEYMLLFNQHIADNLGHIISDYLSNPSLLIKNDKQFATWVGRRNLADCMIDFNKDLQYIRNMFRALVAPYPQPYIMYKGESLIVNEVGFHEQNVETHIGRILNIDNEGIWVKAKNGYVIIKELLDPTGQVISFERFRIGQYFNR